MAEFDDSYELLGELTEDGQYLHLTYWKMLRRALKKFKGKELVIKIAPVKYKRSDAQNRYMWSVIVPYVRHWLHETQGVNFKPDYVYAWLRVELLDEEPTVIDVAGKDVIIMTGKRFSQMSTKEFAEAVDIIRDKMLERGVDIPEPKKKGLNMIHEFLDDN